MVRTARPRKIAMLAATVLGAALTVPVATVPAGAAGACTPPTNPVACENSLPGTPGWDVADDPSIEGFATEMSTNVGGTVSFKIDTTSVAYHVDVYRHGWYGGVGARRVATVNPSVALPQDQPPCLSVPSSGLVDCSNWDVSASWPVPADAVSGVYRAVLVRDDGGGETNHITFVVRSDASHSDLVVQTSDTTWQAYNVWGGNSLYQGGPGTNPNRAYKVSYNRPTQLGQYFDGFETAEYAFVRWVERNGYDVSYISGVDTDRDGASLLNHRAFLSVGHDEYWSAAQRANVTAARDAGVDLAFLSGNEIYWKTRWEPGLDGGDRRTLVTYKESYSPTRLDPTGVWTGTWQDPRNGGGDPANSLTGTLFVMNGIRYDALTVPSPYRAPRLWRGIASWTNPTPDGVLGIEYDTVPDNGRQPPGLIRLSSSIESSPNQAVTDLDGAGVAFGAGTVEHSLTLYRASSGALVFGAGTIQWSWALDPEHTRTTMETDPRIQQATVNLFADFGAQPRTLQSGLTPAAASTDTVAATAAFAQPASGASVPAGQAIAVTGTASDTGGGVPAGVEVSTDDGATWHPAAPGTSGYQTWSYTWTPSSPGPATLRARATDDSANLGVTTSRSVTVTTPTCPCTLFGATTPPTPTVSDPNSVEVGVQFSSASAGAITGVRFYKGSTANGGTHVGRLWTASGTLLASATFTAETASGWQSVSFPTPVPINADTTYVASYDAPSGYYAGDGGFFFGSAFTNPPLTATSGRYRYGSGGAFPTTTSAGNYWVDVTFSTSASDTTPPTVTNTVPAAAATGVPTSTAVTATLSEAIAPGATLSLTRNGTAVAGTSTYDEATRTMGFAPSSTLAPSTTYVATLGNVSDPSGNAMAPVTWSFTTSAGAGTCSPTAPCTLFDDRVPAITTVADSAALTVGVRFSAAADGSVTGVRFYKGSSANGGTHVGRLWTASGVLLASATFTAESASGWQSVLFPSPVAVTAGTTYVASYDAPSGHYAADVGLLASPYTNGPLSATAGTYRYGAGGSFPATTTTHSYAVDVTFTAGSVADTTPPTVVSTVPTAGATGVTVSTPVTATVSEAIQGGATLTLTAGAATVAGTSAYDATARTLRFTPTAALATGTTYTATASGVRDLAGNAMADASWSFTTVAPTPCPASDPCTVFGPSTPPIPVVNDNRAVELGMTFTSSIGGTVTGVRFYKGSSANGGIHIGRLWSSSGVLLASATFVSESTSGWQTVLFSSPVTITAGTQYVASYHAPLGRYSGTVNGLLSPITRSPLTALGARFRYGSGGVFPANTSPHNYWIDVLFTAG